MSKLLIEQLTEEVELAKTAEEQNLEKIASIVDAVGQAQTLTSVGEEMFKIAQELENENLAKLAADTYQLGERFGACLSKTASENGSALEEALEIAEDLHKVASVYAEIAEEVKDEEFGKLAEAVIGIANEMVDEANEVIKQAEVDKEAGMKEGIKEKAEELAAKAREVAGKGKETTMKGYTHVKDFVLAHPKSAKAAGAVAALAAMGYGVKKLTDKK